MKKSMIVLAGITVITLTLAACKKMLTTEQTAASSRIFCSPADTPLATEPIGYYSNLFLQDAAFATVIDKFGNNALDAVSAVYATGGMDAVQQYGNLMNTYSSYRQVEQFYDQYHLDKEVMLTTNAEILASMMVVYQQQPTFYNMQPAEQSTVINSVLASLKDPLFREAHAGSPVVKAYNGLCQRAGTPQNAASKLTMDEVNDCLKGALLGALVGSWKTIRDIYNVITGYNLGWNGIVAVAKSALRTIVGSNTAGILIGFGLCIAWDVFD